MEDLIFVVDDEVILRQNLEKVLTREGYGVQLFEDGYPAWKAVEAGAKPNLIVLDIMMPRMDGLEFCRRFRQMDKTTPIIFLSSRDEEVDRVLGLEMGGDDYVCKPFSLRELTARVKVQLRHSRLAHGAGRETPGGQHLNRGALTLFPEMMAAQWRETSLPLTVSEFRILLALAENPGFVKTREQLLEAAYPDEFYVAGRSVDSHIKRIRRKVSEVEPDWQGLETVYGMGYRFRESP